MPSEFPGSPRMLKGALVVFGAKVPVPTNVIVFQYNPETVTRSFHHAGEEVPREGRAQAGAGDTGAVRGPPVESFQMTVELDAADQLETADPITTGLGVHPALAALELLLYPSSTILLLNKALTRVGIATITPAEVPLVLLVWGPARVVPVRVASVSISEQAFDQLLNPIQARVDLGLRALTEAELARAGPPFDTLGLVNQIGKEVVARLGVANAVEEIRGMLPV